MHLLLVFLVKPRWLIIRLSAKLWLVIRRPSAELRVRANQQPEKGAFSFWNEGQVILWAHCWHHDSIVTKPFLYFQFEFYCWLYKCCSCSLGPVRSELCSTIQIIGAATWEGGQLLPSAGKMKPPRSECKHQQDVNSPIRLGGFQQVPLSSLQFYFIVLLFTYLICNWRADATRFTQPSLWFHQVRGRHVTTHPSAILQQPVFLLLS